MTAQRLGSPRKLGSHGKLQVAPATCEAPGGTFIMHDFILCVRACVRVMVVKG